MGRRLPFTKPDVPQRPTEGTVSSVYLGTARVTCGTTILSNVQVAAPLESDDLEKGDVVALIWIKDRPYATNILGQKTHSRESKTRNKPPLAPVSLVAVGNYLTWRWGGTDSQRKVLDGYEVDARALGGVWGYGAFPLRVGRQEFFSPVAGAQIQCRVRAIDIYGNASVWSSASSALLGSDAVLRDGAVKLTDDWDAGSHKVTLDELKANTSIETLLGTINQLIASTSVLTNAITGNSLGIGIGEPLCDVHIAGGDSDDQGSPTVPEWYRLLVQRTNAMSSVALGVVGSTDGTVSLTLGKPTKVDFAKFELDNTTDLLGIYINDLLAIVCTYDLNAGGVGLSAVDLSAVGHLTACGRLQVGGADRVLFEEDGTMQFAGAATVWDDLTFPAQAINPPGAASDPDRDADDGTLLFDKGSTEIVTGVAQLPHSWKEGSTVYPHVHWCPIDTDTGGVKWQLDYKVASIGGTFPGGWTTVSFTDPADGITIKHQLAPFGGVSMTGHTISCIIQWKLSRIGGDDTYDNDAKLLEFDIHYEKDMLGSRTEYSK